MFKTKIRRLGDLQLRILQILWRLRRASVGVVHEELGGSAQFAYTTIATMLRKMEERRLVGHQEEGRTFIYSARVTEAEVSRTMANDLLDKMFGGSLIDAVNHLLTSREV